MEELRYTLLSDGPADKALMPILTWLLEEHLSSLPIQPNWADLRRLRKPPRQPQERICESIRLYPCDLLFIHRDAEAVRLEDRRIEIMRALANARRDDEIPAAICVVPVRMTEAWLLCDIDAIRQAAGNPNGTVQLGLPSPSNIEGLPNPKRILHDLLRDATELGTRRRKHVDTNKAVQLIPKYTENFSPLRRLSAFVALEDEVEETIEAQGWSN